jgi:hypothetical protein
VVQPLVKAHCLNCHNTQAVVGKLDLSRFRTAADVAKNRSLGELVRERLEASEMPPKSAPRQPTDAERSTIIDWIKAWREAEARRNAGDPGIVLARWLSNAESDSTIRDLTGVDIWLPRVRAVWESCQAHRPQPADFQKLRGQCLSLLAAWM